MSLTATVGKERDLIEEGIFDGVCSKIIDLGTQYSETFKNSAHKIRIFWEIVGETIEINGEQMPRLVSKEFTLSLNEKSKLRQALQSWRGKAFTAEELQGFDLKKVLGVGCQLQIIHKEGNNGTTYANVETILALPRGRSVPAPKEITWFDFDDPASYGVFEKLPRYMQEKIAEAENFADTGLQLPDEKAPANPGISGPQAAVGGADFEEIPDSDFEPLF